MIWAIASSRRPFLPGVPSTQDKEIAERFGQDFMLERVQQGEITRDGTVNMRSTLVMSL